MLPNSSSITETLPGDSTVSERINKLEMFMQIAEVVAKRAVCERGYKVGCVIAPTDLTSVLSIGYNGPARGLPHSCRNEVGNCGCVHAEANALIKAPYDRDLMMFTTLAPCENCARLIINSRVLSVIYRQPYRLNTGLLLLTEAKIRTQELPRY